MSADSNASPSRLIIPAPPELRRGNAVSWYDVRLVPGGDRQSLPGPGRRGEKMALAVSDTELIEEDHFRTVIRDEQAQVDISVRITRSASGVLELASEINGQPFVVSGRADRPETMANIDTPVELDPPESELLNRWGALAASFESLAHATRQSWHCDSCMLMGGAITGSVGCCAAVHLPPCCIGILGFGAQFVENCAGSCAHVHPIVIVEETAWA